MSRAFSCYQHPRIIYFSMNEFHYQTVVTQCPVHIIRYSSQNVISHAVCLKKIYNDMFPTIKVEDRVSSLHWLILHPFLPQQLATTDLYHCLLSFTFFRMSFDLNYIIFSNCLLSQNFLLSLSNMLIKFFCLFMVWWHIYF